MATHHRSILGQRLALALAAVALAALAAGGGGDGERYKTIPDEVRKYAMGFYGRLAARPSDEFLSRAGLRAGGREQRLDHRRLHVHVEARGHAVVDGLGEEPPHR